MIKKKKKGLCSSSLILNQKIAASAGGLSSNCDMTDNMVWSSTQCSPPSGGKWVINGKGGVGTRPLPVCKAPSLNIHSVVCCLLVCY